MKRPSLILTVILAGFMTATYAEKPRDVNVVNTPGITVENDSSNPVPVKLNDPQTPIQVQEYDTSCTPGSCSADVYTVPDGKRLLITHISILTQIDTSANPGDALVRLSPTFDGQNRSIPVGITANTGPGLNSFDVFSSPVSIYAEPGVVRCSIGAPEFQPIILFSCYITGILEDAN